MEQVHFLDQGRKALGEILLGLKKVDQNTLDSALEDQKRLNFKLGDILLQKGVLTKKELDYALALQQGQNPNAPILARKKLGDLLLETGKISPAQLQAALSQQNVSQKKIGEVLLEMGFVNQKDLDSAVNLQDSLAFSSRNAVLQRLQAPGSATGVVAKPKAHETGNLDQHFASRGQFLDVVLPRAFESAFGRGPTVEEAGQFKHKAEFLFGGTGTLKDGLPPEFGSQSRATAVDKLDTYFQNVIADRVTQLVGGDLVHKRFDAQGHVDVVGLGDIDLQIAIEIATTPGFDLNLAMKDFLDKSPRALFKTALGRDFKSPEEEAFYDREIEGPHGAETKAFLNWLHESTDRAFKPYHISRNDKELSGKLVLSEVELREALTIFRENHMDHAFEELVSSRFFLEKLKIADTAEAGHSGEAKAIKIKQVLKKIMELLQSIMGSVPPALAGKIANLVAKAESGEISMTDIDSLVKDITDMFEKILTMFAKAGKTATPDDIAAALMAMIDAMIGGETDLEGPVLDLIDKLKGGGSVKGGMSLEDACAFVNGLNFNFNAVVGSSADATNPMVKGLMTGAQTPQALNSSFTLAAKSGKSPIPEERAIAFVAHLNETFRGARIVPDADDQWVKKMIKGEMLPGEVAKHWRGLYQAATTVESASAKK